MRYTSSLSQTSPPQVVFLLTVPRRFLCCSSSLFVCQSFHIWRLFCHYLFLISPSFGALGRLFIMTVAFPGYLYLSFYRFLYQLSVNFLCVLP